MTGGQIGVVMMFAVIIMLVLGLAIQLTLSERARKKTPYKEIDRGVYDRAEYASEGGKYGGEVTVIHFEDGRTAVLRRFHAVPFKRGDEVKVMENEWDSKLEKA